MQNSLAASLASLPAHTRTEILATLSPAETTALLRDWRFWARPKQLPPPGDWLLWLILSGRGWGKTATGAHWLLEQTNNVPRVAVVAATFADGRDICIEGETGLKTICPELVWNRSIGEMTFPSGCKGKLFSGEEPDRCRGPNIYAYWADEIASWSRAQETWDNLMLMTRKGEARGCGTTTPRPIPLLKALLAQPSTQVTRGHTYENRANLAPAFMKTIVARYEGTRLGRQELGGELLEDVEGALWQRAWIDAARVTTIPVLVRVVVAVDPSTQAEGARDACGIVVAGIGANGHGYILDDRTLHGSPHAWATAAVAAYHTHKADALVAEANNGGALVQVNIGTIAGAPPVTLVHASRGKQTRAEPVANLDQQVRVHHVGYLPLLEDEMCSWVPGVGDSPNRIDARVWACSALMLAGGQPYRGAVGGTRSAPMPTPAPVRY